MIGKTLRDPEVQGNNEPSGRFNLKGQQKPQYLIDAENEAEKLWTICMRAIERHEEEDTKQSFLAKQVAESQYSKAWERFKEMQMQWNRERKCVTITE